MRSLEPLELASELFELVQYVVLLYEPVARARTATRLDRVWRRPGEAFREWLHTQQALTLLEGELDEAIDQLQHRAQSFESQLTDFGLARLARPDAFRFFRQLVNYDPAVLSATTSATPDA